jgi:hypothetical protein
VLYHYTNKQLLANFTAATHYIHITLPRWFQLVRAVTDNGLRPISLAAPLLASLESAALRSPDLIATMDSSTPPALTDTTVAPSHVDLTLLTSSPIRDKDQDKENQLLVFQNLADRIKGRSRRAAQIDQMAPVGTTMPPQQPPSRTPQKARPPKRLTEVAAEDSSTRRHKVLRGKDTAVREDKSATASPTSANSDVRPLNDSAGYRDFAEQVLKTLKIRLKPHAVCYGDRQNERIHYLLENARPADNEEMLFLSGVEAAVMLQPGVFHDGPILTEGQQPLPLQTVQDFLGEYYDDDTSVFVQDPSVKIASRQPFVVEVAIRKVKKRILEGKTKGRPWNCLELATHVEDGLRPKFLAGEDSRLLTKLKLEHTDYAGRRSYPQGYKEVEKWALLAEQGALTEPHQDSHGYSTYITANQGRIGFGWLSYPSAEERENWIRDPVSLPGDRYRYVVLKEGQTVFFPAGTVHFVFRLPSAGHTLAFGGHVLRCSNITHWARSLLEEKANPGITNEDLTSSAPGYLNRVEKFVLQAQQNGSSEKWGGDEEIEEFLRLKEEFMVI